MDLDVWIYGIYPCHLLVLASDKEEVAQVDSSSQNPLRSELPPRGLVIGKMRSWPPLTLGILHHNLLHVFRIQLQNCKFDTTLCLSTSSDEKDFSLKSSPSAFDKPLLMRYPFRILLQQKQPLISVLICLQY